jgi:hypothetical protein
VKRILALLTALLLATFMPNGALAVDDPLPVFICVGGSN